MSSALNETSFSFCFDGFLPSSSTADRAQPLDLPVVTICSNHKQQVLFKNKIKMRFAGMARPRELSVAETTP